MEGKHRISIMNVALILVLIVCVIVSIILIVLSKSKIEIEAIEKSGDEIEKNYTSTEETSNSWDVSVNGDGSVMAILAEDGTLTISGTGDMKDYTFSSGAPWYTIRNEIKSVKIENGVTSIGCYAFFNCTNLISI